MPHPLLCTYSVLILRIHFILDFDEEIIHRIGRTYARRDFAFSLGRKNM